VTASRSKERVKRVEVPAGLFPVAVSGAIVAGFWGSRPLLVALVLLVGAAAFVDVESALVPNEVVIAVLIAALARAVGVLVRGDGTAPEVARDLALGVVASGGLAMFVVWLARPQAIGGGDWKMLAAVGAAVGLVDVAAAAIVGVVAMAAQLITSAVLRRRVLPFAPALFAGTATSALMTTWFHFGAGGWT
jgi:prepilin signal peptidase PulO-like enzyme (type II secretory pathway)